MGMYIQKPVVIEARCYLMGIRTDGLIAEWCGGTVTDKGIVIDTLEGDMLAENGDWIIKGVAGEFYPCKPQIFVQTYEPVEDE